MPYSLKWEDRQSRQKTPAQGTINPTLCAGDFYTLSEGLNNLRLQVTSQQFTKIWSAAVAGAELLFPDDYADILFLLLQASHCPIEDESECFEFLPSAAFVKFYPDNPYIEGDNQAGWWREAWFQWSDFFSLFPDFAADWLAGAVGGFVGYQNTDVLCNIASLAYPTWQAFFNAGGVFPKIEIKFSGKGQVNISMLSFPLGGKAIISLDDEPNIVDILTGGILDPDMFMIELDRDIVSFPPQEYPLLVIPVDVAELGNHTIYINFIPVVNDETTFLKFGGGIRSVEFCGFAEETEVGIEQVIWDGCALKVVQGGITTQVVTAAEIQACMDIPEGGGGGAGSSVKVTVLNPAETSAQSGSSTGFNGTYRNVNHNFTKSKALIQYKFGGTQANAGETSTFRINGNQAGLTLMEHNEDIVVGQNPKECVLHWHIEGISAGLRSIYIQGKTTAGGNYGIASATGTTVFILEWDNADDLFIQDVRYLDGVLQKQLGGVWFDVVDIEALLAPIQSLAASANTAAANALTVANNAASVNAAQQTTINNHEARLDTLEDTVSDLVTIDIPQINLTIADHETRIDALEAAGGSSGDWAGEKLGRVQDLFSALNPAGGRYSIIDGSYQTSPVAGIQADSAQNIVLLVNDANRYSSVAFVGITIFMLASPDSIKMSARINDNAHQQRLDFVSIGVNNYFRAYLPIVGRDDGVPPHPQSSMLISLGSYDTSLDETDWRLIGLTYLCFAINPFTGTLFP